VPYGKRIIGLDAFTALSLSFKSTTAVFYLTSLFPSIDTFRGAFGFASISRGALLLEQMASVRMLSAYRSVIWWCSPAPTRPLTFQGMLLHFRHVKSTELPMSCQPATSGAALSPSRTPSYSIASLVSSPLTCKSHQTASYHGNNYPKPHSQLAPRASHPYTQASQPHSAPLSSSRTLATAASLPIALV
jgi:hypothetical protein